MKSFTQKNENMCVYNNAASSDWDQFIEKSLTDYFVEHEDYDQLYDGRSDGYLIPLILKGKKGETQLTIPGAIERDFAFYWHGKCNVETFGNFLYSVINRSEPIFIKIPLLSLPVGNAIINHLSGLRQYKLYLNVNNHVPSINKTCSNYIQCSSLIRAHKKINNVGKLVSNAVFNEQLQNLHQKKWGANRSLAYFRFLEWLSKQKYVKCYSIENNHEIIAIHIDILSTNTTHYYYSIWDNNIKLGIGTHMLAESYCDFIKDDVRSIYSFGRGAERYKYRYANNTVPLFNLIGIYSPI